MNESVADLLARYERAITAGGEQASDLVDGYNTLRLADAALDKQALNKNEPTHPLQFVILGPTQAGKSTLCNLLLDTNAAGISALAGYTVHAQGFATNVVEGQLGALTDLMLPLTRVTSSELRANDLDHFVLDIIKAGNNSLVDQGVVWDSPDFDSVEASGYRGAVLQAAAMADVLILMVSKDKYADKSVWDMLKLVKRLGKPLFVCINKLDERDRQTVVDSFKQRHQEQFNDAAPEIIALPFVRNDSPIPAADTTSDIATTPLSGTEQAINIGADARMTLSAAIERSIEKIDRTGQNQHIADFVQHHWPQWMAPIELESEAQDNWQKAVDDAIENAKERYATRYLNNPQKYDTFNKAIAELLTLLEIPGIASTLSATRSVVTWPARKLFKLGRSIKERGVEPADQELEVLDLILEQTLTTLQGHILVEQQESQGTQTYWASMQKALTQNKDLIRGQYTQRAEQIQKEFEPRIDEAAQQLYVQLQDQPMLLNTLRAARASTDAAAVVLAVKSGGLAPADLVIAPAMLSVTTLLTESALGQYMERSKNQLKEEQQALVDAEILEKALGEKLIALSNELKNGQLLLAGHEPLPELSLNNSLS